MAEKVIDIEKRFSRELSNIAYRLRNLENGLVTDKYPQAKMYGSLAHNISKLREELNDLLSKIQYGRDSISEELAEAFFLNKEKDI